MASLKSAGSFEIQPEAVEAEELGAFFQILVSRGTLGTQAPPRLIGPDGSEIPVPREIYGLVVTVVEQLRAGNAISVMPLHQELTTVEAADLLNVSRPFLIKQLEAKEIPYRKVGAHRRIRLRDVIAYRERMAASAEDALQQMTDEAEELGLYDD
jgi:excisionase family DNA binding protein